MSPPWVRIPLPLHCEAWARHRAPFLHLSIGKNSTFFLLSLLDSIQIKRHLSLKHLAQCPVLLQGTGCPQGQREAPGITVPI